MGWGGVGNPDAYSRLACWGINFRPIFSFHWAGLPIQSPGDSLIEVFGNPVKTFRAKGNDERCGIVKTERLSFSPVEDGLGKQSLKK